MSGRVKLAAWFSIYCLACPGITHAQQQVVGASPEAQNMKLVGTSDLQGRSAYMPTIHRQGDRYIAYVGHHGGSKEIPAPVNTVTGKRPTARRSLTSPIRQSRNICGTFPVRRA